MTNEQLLTIINKIGELREGMEHLEGLLEAILRNELPRVYELKDMLEKPLSSRCVFSRIEGSREPGGAGCAP